MKIIRSQKYCETLYDALSRKLTDPDYEWADVADDLSIATGEDVSRDTIRRGSYVALELLENGWVTPPSDGGDSSTIDAKKLELEKARIRLRDERNEISRIQRELARRESMMDMMIEVIQETVEPEAGYTPHTFTTTDSDLIIHLTDLHCGLETSNFFNQFDQNVLYRRLDLYLDKIDQVRQRHEAQDCYLLLGGDLISGIIHSNLRLESNMDVMRQVKAASRAVVYFCKALSHMFGQVNVYSVAGNHGRVFPKKEDNLKGENLDILIPFYLETALERYENVVVFENDIEESVAMFKVRGNTVFGVHGDKDEMSSVVQKLTMFLDRKPDIILAGHRHTNGYKTVYDTKVIESGCVSGPDNYCMDKRIRNRPEQTISVVTEDGLECIYDVTLK